MTSPFKFLDAYQEEDAKRFFGRSKETAQLYNAVHTSNLTLLYGASGTGKTSLVNCGLGNKFYSTDWLPIPVRRGENINVALNNEIERTLGDWSVDGGNIIAQIRELYFRFHKPIYFIFDQFEELFILGTAEEQQEFYQRISDILKSGLQAKMIIIIREEWIAWLNEFEKQVPTLFDNRLRVERMNDRNLFKVILGTCRFENIEITDPKTTIPLMLQQLRKKKEQVELTHLQVYLDRLYRKAAEKKAETIQFDEPLVREVGAMDNVLSHFLDEQMGEIEQKLKKRGIKNTAGLPLEILFTLVTDDGTKQSMNIATILENLPKNRKLSPDDVLFCIEELNRIKLLRIRN